MALSEKTISIISITVTLIGVPLAAWLSYVYACLGFKEQAIESKTVEMFEAKNRLISDLTTYGIIVRDLGQKAGMKFNKTDGGDLTTTDAIPNPEAFFTSIYEQTQIHEWIVNDTIRLRELGFDILLEKHDPKAYQALVQFCLFKSTYLDKAQKAELIGKQLLHTDTIKSITSITKDEIRAFVTLNS